jgi:hypothetical protein
MMKPWFYDGGDWVLQFGLWTGLFVIADWEVLFGLMKPWLR